MRHTTAQPHHRGYNHHMRTSSQGPYDSGFYREQSHGSLESAQRLVPVVVDLLHPSSVLDVGCGVGTWLSVFQSIGIRDLFGVDYGGGAPARLLIPRDRFLAHDLSQRLDLGRVFDVVLALEVAEHLDESVSDIFVDSLVRHSDVVVFSAAIPGQGGTHHVNEQWPSYWIEKFAVRQFVVRDVLRGRVWSDTYIERCYRQNALIFVRNTSGIARTLNTSAPYPVDIVHPEQYDHARRISAIVGGHLISKSPRTFRIATASMQNLRQMRASAGRTLRPYFRIDL